MGRVLTLRSRSQQNRRVYTVRIDRCYFLTLPKSLLCRRSIVFERASFSIRAWRVCLPISCSFCCARAASFLRRWHYTRQVTSHRFPQAGQGGVTEDNRRGPQLMRVCVKACRCVLACFGKFVRRAGTGNTYMLPGREKQSQLTKLLSRTNQRVAEATWFARKAHPTKTGRTH